MSIEEKSQKILQRRKDLAELQRHWYRKLKSEGFRDIESFDSSMEPVDKLKQSCKNITTTLYIEGEDEPEESIEYTTTVGFYQRADRLIKLDETVKVFRIPPDKEVWEMYRVGKEVPEIAETTGFSRAQVRRKIKKYTQTALEL